MIFINAEIQIPDWELEFSFARSSGPGGQNVNKVNSKAVMHWNVMNNTSIRDEVKARFLSRYAARLSSDGTLVLMSDRFRDQGRNKEDCISKLRALLLEVAFPPRPRKKTKPSKSSVRKNQNRKRQHSEKKKLRGRVRGD